MSISILQLVHFVSQLSGQIIVAAMVFITTCIWVISLRLNAVKREYKMVIDTLKSDHASHINRLNSQVSEATKLLVKDPTNKGLTQAEYIAKAQISKRKIMNTEEFGLFRHLESWVANQNLGYRLFVQVSLGEIFGTSNLASENQDHKQAFFAFNSKRVDFLFVDRSGLPILAIEYNGTGHFQGNAVYRDAIKRAVFQKANVKLVDVLPGFSETEIHDKLDRHFLRQTNCSQAAPSVTNRSSLVPNKRATHQM